MTQREVQEVGQASGPSGGRRYGHSLQVRGSRPAGTVSSRDMGALPGDIFSCHSWRGLAPGTLQCIGKPELFRIDHNYLSQDVNRAKDRNPTVGRCTTGP